MPATQSNYVKFYRDIEDDVNDMCRINIHKRIYSNLRSEFGHLKSRFKEKFEYNVIRVFAPDYYYKLQSKRQRMLYGLLNGYGHTSTPLHQMTTPSWGDYIYSEPTDEKISLSQYAYGKLIDQKYKKRFIDAENLRSHESSLAIQKEAANYLFEQKMKSSFLLRFINFFHLN